MAERRTFYLFEVTKRPIGPAPDHIKDAWVRVTLAGEKRFGNEYNVVTGEAYPDREHYVADARQSLLVLAACTKNPSLAQEAIRWYLDKGQRKFCFGLEEIQPIIEISEDDCHNFLDWFQKR